MSNLPDLMEMDDYAGDYVDRLNQYLDDLYQVYLDEVAHGRLMFRGLRVSCMFRPETRGKHYAFWHMMQEDGRDTGNEDDRNIDPERCRRVRWIAWVIKNAGRDERIRVFQQSNRRTSRRSNLSWALWIPDENYVVILWERNNHYLLKTAYVVKYKSAEKQLERDWNAYKNRQGSP